MDPPASSEPEFDDIVDLSQDERLDETPSNHSVKRVRLQWQEATSSGSSTGRPMSTL